MPRRARRSRLAAARLPELVMMRRRDAGQDVQRAGIGPLAVMEDAVLIEEEEVVAVGDGAEAGDLAHHAISTPRPRQARRAAPAAASSARAGRKGTPSRACRMRVQ